MSLPRWTATASVMAAAAWALVLLGPDADRAWQSVSDPQALVDSAGPDALLVPLATAAGWLCWGWGALGLLLTAAAALPGAAGRVADLARVVVLPAGARRLAAAAVGLTLSTGTAVVLPPALPGLAVATATDVPVDRAPGAPPDWPGAPAAPPPAGSSAEPARVVLRGDCLWDIAAEWLAAGRSGAPARDAEVHAAVQAWWQANATVIGPDPDLLLPGQVLSPPVAGPAAGAPPPPADATGDRP